MSVDAKPEMPIFETPDGFVQPFYLTGERDGNQTPLVRGRFA